MTLTTESCALAYQPSHSSVKAEDGDPARLAAPGRHPKGRAPVEKVTLRRGLLPQVPRRQAIGQDERGEHLSPFAVLARHQQLEPPGGRRIETASLGQHEERLLAQGRRVGDGKLVDPPMLILGQAIGAGALNDLYAIEGARSHVAGALERIDALCGKEQQGVAQAALRGQPGVRLVPQQVAADQRRVDQRGVEGDEVGARIARQPGQILDPQPPESVYHRAIGEGELGDRVVRPQRGPILRREGIDVDRVEHPAGPADDPEAPGHRTARAEDHVVERQRADGGAGDAVDGLRARFREGGEAHRIAYVDAPVLGDEGFQVLILHPDDQDRLVVLDQTGARDPSLEIETDGDVQGLAREARTVDHVGAEKRVTDDHPILVGGIDLGVIGLRPEAVGAGKRLVEMLLDRRGGEHRHCRRRHAAQDDKERCAQPPHRPGPQPERTVSDAFA
jgi:hypothetical protein